MKCCKIISTYFYQRKERTKEYRGGVAWPIHIQFDLDPKGVLTMLKDQVSIETDIDAGVECDTIIVNSNSGFEEGNNYIKSINGQKTRSGQIISMEMENRGGQFGAYNLAYSMFEGKYDYWMLDEDDIIITGHQYYKKLIDRLGENEVYALIGVERPSRSFLSKYGKQYSETPMAAGALLLMHRSVLEHLKTANGSLPHPTKNDYRSRVRHGEVAWPLRLFELGYKIVYKGKSIMRKSIEWDYENDYCLSYRDMIERFQTSEKFKQTDFYKGVV